MLRRAAREHPGNAGNASRAHWAAFRGTSAATRAAASSATGRRTWVYRSWVIRVVEWPSCAETTFMSIPASRPSVAAVCLPSWNLITGSPALRASCLNQADTRSGG